jgi:membrane protein
MLRFLRLFRLALWRGFEHDIFIIARAAAYYSILTLFPSLMVAAWGLAASHKTVAFIKEIASAANAIMPPGSAVAVKSYFEDPRSRPLPTLFSASFITLFAASGVFVSWMEGFRNAYRIERVWGVVKERFVALLLVLLAFVPMTLATLSVAFGYEIQDWLVLHVTSLLGPAIYAIYFLWTVLRWVISMMTSIAVLALVYHLGIPRWQPWYRVVPGATLATLLWFAATDIFGWYVTRFATYNAIYGSLGAAIALLVWMYIISLIVLVGAEFNALIYPRVIVTTQPDSTPFSHQAR